MTDEDDYDDTPQDECDHDAYEIDILTGRAECAFCSQSWYLTSEELDCEIERQASYHEDCEREERRQWWRDLFSPITPPFWRLRRRISEWNTRRQFPEHVNDDIPF